MEHNGYSYIIKRSVPETGTIYYSCSKFRKDCKARLIIRHGKIAAEKGMHSCIEVAASAVVDVRADMRLELQRRSVAQLSAAPAVLWQQMRDEMSQRYPGSVLQDIPRGPGVTIIKKTRKDCTGGDALAAIQVATVRCVSSTDHRAFLQFSVVHAACAGSGTNHIIGFAHPDLIRLLRYPKITLFIDGTFAIVPKPFTQCLIVMVFDAAVDVYVPALYVLVDSKTQETYARVLYELYLLSGRVLDPAAVTCDFELALINAVRERFPCANVVGCLFHWKQALRRKMIDLRIPREQISMAMAPGKLDVLTLIREEEIASKGMRFVRHSVDETGSKVKWNTFWKYFLNTWMGRYDVSTWNLSAQLSRGDDIVNRTNNPLEKYNRDSASRLGGPHPSLLVFVDAAKSEATRYTRLIDDIKQGRQQAPAHSSSVAVSVPADYIMFERE